MRRTEFWPANFGQRIPYLWFEPDARAAPPDADIAHHKRALSVRA